MKKSPLEIVIITILIVLATLVLVRILAPFRFALLAFFSVLILGISIYFAIQFFKNRKHGFSIEGNLEQRIKKSEHEIVRLKQELSEIRGNIMELRQQLKNPQLNTHTRQETERLLKEFEHEINLRTTKIQFFNTAIQKLNYLLDNHRQTRILEAKQAHLKKLRSNQYEELAKIETLKSNLELDQRQLENIETLTLKILKSDTLGAAEDVQKELVILTKELK